MTPRSLAEILAHADEYAAVFENYVPRTADEVDVDAYRELENAAAGRVEAEVRVAAAVERARAGNLKWGTIGRILGTSGEAARQRYGRPKRSSA